MPSLDISRNILEPQKRYARVGFQQGRVPLDSDANDAEALGAEELSRALAEAICGAGSPNDGFRIGTVSVDEETRLYDFPIGEGSFFLGGLRFDQPAETASYTTQNDWLQRAPDAPDFPEAPDAERTDLVWLEAWEQPVSATEDSELIEPALGGPDTTGRVRRNWRVRVETDVPDDCSDAFDELIAAIGSGATFDAASGTLNSGTELTVGFADAGEPENLCTPTARDGFLGARNETYRVRITTPGRFIWGRDNASPVYRVRVADHVVDGASTGLRRIEFLTLPRDQFAQPLAGQAVELHRWGALLPNDEKQAEQTGRVLTVERGYDPADDSIVVSEAVPQDWLDWFDAEGSAALSDRDEEGVRRYFYLRLWTGGSGDATDPDHAFTVDAPAALGDTGLTVAFSATGRPGDFWVISARPNTPRDVQPWRLLDGAPPNGPVRRIAPLALIRWRAAGGDTPEPEVEECRHRFRPLCRAGTCCTIMVGDGHSSHGDVDSIAAAIERLPAGGGEICLLPGEYREHVTLERRSNVIITGCGARSRWLAEAGSTEPLLTIRDASNVTVRRLRMVTLAGRAVTMERGGTGELDSVLLSELDIAAADRSAIAGFEGNGIAITQCRVSLEETTVSLDADPAVGREAGIYLDGENLSIERCHVRADPGRTPGRQPLGGIQIGGASERVLIRHNVIDGGNGHGVTLGSIRYVPADPQDPTGLGMDAFTGPLTHFVPGTGIGSHIATGLNIGVDQRGCLVFDPRPVPPPPGDDGETLVPASEGTLYEVRIHDNDIRAMGLSGISVPFFFELTETEDYIAIEDLEVLRNRIEGCLRGDLAPFTGSMRLAAGYGGVALALVSDGTFRDNEIVGNGRESLAQISGIFVLFGAALTIERNRIHDNGRRAERDDTTSLGRRGGVVIGLALDGSGASFVTESGLGERRQALRLHGNVIDSPNARALKAIALGPVSVADNRLSGRGRAALGQYVPLFSALLLGSLAGGGTASGILDFVALAGGRRSTLFGAGLETLEIFLEVIGGDVVSLLALAPPERLNAVIDVTHRTTHVPTALATGGAILFNDNQVTHAAHAQGQDMTLSANLIVGLDDVLVSANQFRCDNDIRFVFVNGLVVGMTVRVADNRFQEPFSTGSNDFRAYLSALTAAHMMNATTFNQGNHCFFVAGPAGFRIDENQSLIGAFGFCRLTSNAGGMHVVPVYHFGSPTGGT